MPSLSIAIHAGGHQSLARTKIVTEANKLRLRIEKWCRPKSPFGHFKVLLLKIRMTRGLKRRFLRSLFLGE